MESCRSCGARLFEGSTFCARCLTPVRPSDHEVDALLGEVEAAGGRWQAPPTAPERWRPHERFAAPKPEYVHSRTRKSALTFGLGARVALTAAILGAGVITFLLSPSPGSGLVFIVVGGWALKDVWKKARIRIR